MPVVMHLPCGIPVNAVCRLVAVLGRNHQCCATERGGLWSLLALLTLLGLWLSLRA